METNEIKIRTCPICGTAYRGHPAISRTDNESLICSDCGTRESLQAIGISDDEIEKIIEIMLPILRKYLSVLHRHTAAMMTIIAAVHYGLQI